MDAFYVTTPIYYVNAEPHLGHAYTTILADVLAAFHRADGKECYLLTGTDENAEKVVQVAQAQGITAQELCDRNSETFRRLWRDLGLVPSDFIRTSEERHRTVVSTILQKVYDGGDMYFDHYEGLYCLGCERYMSEKDLVDGRCPDHDKEPEKRSEDNWFFRMEKYRPWLLQYVQDNPDFIRPEGFRKEALGLLEQPIGDLSISRPVERVPNGIPLPWDPKQVTYVWFDALINYISALGWPSGELFKRYWPKSCHLIGKDILKPHTIFWPCMLKAAQIEPYNEIKIHGYWLTDEGKMSKSRGNVVKPLDLAKKYGIDTFRYYLMRDMSFGRDATFSELGLAERSNTDLANDLGNLLHRTLGMVNRYHKGVLKGSGEIGTDEVAMQERILGLVEGLRENVAKVEINRGLESIMEVVRSVNQYIDQQKPWVLAKEDPTGPRLETVLYTCAETLRIASVLLEPIMPGKMRELRAQLGLGDEPSTLEDARRWGGILSGTKVAPGEPLFPRVDLDELRTAIAGRAAKESEEEPPSKKVGKKETMSEETKAAKAAEEPARKTAEKPATPAVPAKKDEPDEINFDDFMPVVLLVAKVETCEKVEGADKLLKMTLDAGSAGHPTVVAGLAPYYEADALVGRRVLWVSNLKPRKMRGVVSQGMLLAAEGPEQGVKIIEPAADAILGSRVH